MFNASASSILQNNGSILNGSTWYSLKFNKIEKQCIPIPGFDNENHSCIINPNDCPEGISMEVWLYSSFESLDPETIISSGTAPGGGYVGYFVYLVEKRINVLVSSGEEYWHVEKTLPVTVLPGEWFNLAFRWRQDKGLQVFVTGALLEEIPFSRTKKDVPEFPADNKLYVGCRYHNQKTVDFVDVGMDELAFWRKFLPDSKLKWFTGAIVDAVEDTVFTYETDLEVLEPEEMKIYNPYYKIAYHYEPYDNEVADFDYAVINITRGHGKGVYLPNTTADVLLTTSGADLNNYPDGLSLSVWIHLHENISDFTDQVLLEATNWRLTLNNMESFTIYSRYNTYNETGSYFMVDWGGTFSKDLLGWTNIAFSWHPYYNFSVYVNGDAVEPLSVVTENVEGEEALNLGADLRQISTSLEITVSDLVIWNRYLYNYEGYRFLGMKPSEYHLQKYAHYYWTTDYYVTLDTKALRSWNPLFKTVESTAQTTTGMEGEDSKSKAVTVGNENGWLMLGHTEIAEFEETTGQEFADTCIGDPDICLENGLTAGLWINLQEVPASTTQKYTIFSSGEEDELSRGVSIALFNSSLHIAITNSTMYWKVTMDKGRFPIGEWFHLAFTWKYSEGLWGFLNGELIAANKDGLALLRPYNRYTRLTLGRTNGDNNFANFFSFSIQEIAINNTFTVTYNIRKQFFLTENEYYETADYYWNRDELITSRLSLIEPTADTNLPTIGPKGTVVAFNNTISVVGSAVITLGYFTTSDCIFTPSRCEEGITVSLWSRNNLFMSEEEALDDVIYILSSHDQPERIRAGEEQGWTFFYEKETWRVVLVSDGRMWNATHSLEVLKPQRWTNLAFTWNAAVGVTLFTDGKTSGMLKAGHLVAASSRSVTTDRLIVGHETNSNFSSIGIFSVGIWKKRISSTIAWQVTGHTESVMLKYSDSDLMWTFDGPIHMCNRKYNEITLGIETYDDTLKGAAAQVTRDGMHKTQVGNFSEECLSKPLTKCNSLMVGMKLKLSDYTPGEGEDDRGSVLLVGSPDANFAGVAIQQVNWGTANQLAILVAGDHSKWNRTINAPVNTWFDIVFAWNKLDGIAVKLNNKLVKEGKFDPIYLQSGTAYLDTNEFLLGVGSGGDGKQGIDAMYNDIFVSYKAELTIDPEGRCYDSAGLYFRLDKVQLFPMNAVKFDSDRDGLKELAFNLVDDGAYVELDEFPNSCFSDPSYCTSGLCMSFWLNVTGATVAGEKLISSGYPHTKGYQIFVTPAQTTTAYVHCTVQLNNGKKTWQAEIRITPLKWTNVGFCWSETGGLSFYKDGALLPEEGQDTTGKIQTRITKRSHHNIVLGRGNDAADQNYSKAIFDDVAMWDEDLRLGEKNVSVLLLGADCKVENLVVEAAPAIEILTTPPVIVQETQERDCFILVETMAVSVCAQSWEDYFDKMSNTSIPIDGGLNHAADFVGEIREEKLNKLETKPTVSAENVTEVTILVSRFAKMPVAPDIDPRDSQSMIEDFMTIGTSLLNPQNKEVWEELKVNATIEDTAPGLLKNIDKLITTITKNTKLGFNIEDDCTKMDAKVPDAVMAGYITRIKLCAKNYTLPHENTNSTTAVAFSRENWDLVSLPDDAVITFAMIEYNNIDEIMGAGKEIGTMVDLEATTSADNPEAAKDLSLVRRATVNSAIVSVVVDPMPPTPFAMCLKITLTLKEVNTGNKRESYCVYWDYQLTTDDSPSGAWSGEGCEVSNTNETHVECCCYHATAFTILTEPAVIEPFDYEARNLQLITYATIGISLFSLLLFMLIIICNKSLRSERSMVHLNLCVSTILSLTCYLLVEFVRENRAEETKGYCKALAIAQHYFFLVSYMWVFMEAICLFYAVLYGRLVGKMSCYAPAAWLLPVVDVVIFSAMRHEMYGLNDLCWITYNNYLVLMAMIGPILIFILFEGCTLFIIICNLPSPTLKREDILSEVRWAVLFAVLLLPYLFFIWMVTALRVFKFEFGEMFNYIHAALFGLQGFFFFLVYGIGQRSIRMGIIRKKYRPQTAPGKTNLLPGSSQTSLNDSQFVDVKPQPLKRPSSKKSKDRKTPSPTEDGRKSVQRRESDVSSASSNAGGYIP